MAGGVALNCVANGKVLRETDFRKLWVQPAAGDAGGALGAAYLAWHRYLAKERILDNDVHDDMCGSQLGTEYTDREIERFLQQEIAVYEELEEEALLGETARLLERGSVVGWYQGRMEFGPRALGNRSILADPRNAHMTDEINRRIKFRESFRPFAPAVLEDEVGSYFDLQEASPYMSLVVPVLEDRRSMIPAVTHVDGSARVQTVAREVNPLFYRLLKVFQQVSGHPVLLNTSFNGRGEPIVESPRQAYQCFMRAGIDVLVMNRFMLKKEKQPTGL
jgi:carbamoyltransferase